MMVWHIFRKDLRLSLKFALVTAMLQWVATGMLMFSSLPEYRVINGLRSIVRDAGTLAVFLLVVIVVHRDAVPGATHDWLMRPIRRKDMLLAKFLFFVMAIQLPILVGCVVEGITLGLGFQEAFFGALWQSAMLTLGVGVAALAISAMTASVVEAAIAAGICLVAAALMEASGSWGAQFSAGAPVTDWIEGALLIGGMFAAGVVALGIQYRRRATMRARVAWSVVFVLGAAGSFLPVKAALSFEQRIAPAPGAGQNVRVAFDPSGRYFGTAGPRLPPVYLPIRVEGLAHGTAIIADRAEVQVTGASGTIRKLSTAAPPALASGVGYQAIEELGAGALDTPVQVHADYWLTLVKETGEYTVPELNGDVRSPLLGRCRTSSTDGSMGEFRCVKAGPVSGCLAMDPALAQFGSGLRCTSYAPPFVWLPDWDEIVITVERFQLSDKGDGHVTVKTYQAVDHFERSLDIPNVRLRDWVAAARI